MTVYNSVFKIVGYYTGTKQINIIMTEYRITHDEKVFIINENGIYTPTHSNFCIKLECDQMKTILQEFEQLGAKIERL